MIYCGLALVRALHRTPIPLHSIAAGDLDRYVSTLNNGFTEMNEFEVHPPLRTKQTNLITRPTVIRFLYCSPKQPQTLTTVAVKDIVAPFKKVFQKRHSPSAPLY